jgi:L-serine dehydratase
VTISVLDLFTIGIGPSSSHAVGPMRAAARFLEELQQHHQLSAVARLRIELFGSLGATGRGHGTDRAVLLGLEGETPEDIDPNVVASRVELIRDGQQILLGGRYPVAFDLERDLVFSPSERLARHPNALRFAVWDEQATLLRQSDYYSIGGGFVVHDADAEQTVERGRPPIPFPFRTAAELVSLCKEHSQPISGIVLRNERTWRSEAGIRSRLLRVWEVMQECVRRGCESPGILPGPLEVERRAPRLYRELIERPEAALRDPLSIVDWVNLYALAVAEENAAGGRVVTAPTNGAAGIIPAVLHYYARFCPSSSDEGVVRFLLTAGAIGMLYKENASISGAEVGCQGEVGVACSMAAGALTEVLGGTVDQVEQAAEIGMEHNLGLTCDPIGGLVQVPCIERNAMGTVKAINAARLALRGDGKHKVTLDRVIGVMRRTGADMSEAYKETSRGGLAVNMPEC